MAGIALKAGTFFANRPGLSASLMNGAARTRTAVSSGRTWLTEATAKGRGYLQNNAWLQKQQTNFLNGFNGLNAAV